MFRTVICGSTVLLLCSCASEINMRDDFGNSVKHNIAVQTIEPIRTQPDSSDSLDGMKARSAIERYRQSSPEIQSESLIEE